MPKNNKLDYKFVRGDNIKVIMNDNSCIEGIFESPGDLQRSISGDGKVLEHESGFVIDTGGCSLEIKSHQCKEVIKLR